MVETTKKEIIFFQIIGFFRGLTLWGTILHIICLLNSSLNENEIFMRAQRFTVFTDFFCAFMVLSVVLFPTIEVLYVVISKLSANRHQESRRSRSILHIVYIALISDLILPFRIISDYIKEIDNTLWKISEHSLITWIFITIEFVLTICWATFAVIGLIYLI